MTTSNLRADSSYLVIQRKLFTRFALPYEVILDSWCCTLNHESLVGGEVAQHFIDSEAFTEELIVLQLCQMVKAKPAYSFSQLEQVFFSSSDSLEQFYDRNYDNFDVNSLSCIALDKNETGRYEVSFNLEKPSKPMIKPELVPNDGVLALIFERVSADSESTNDLKNLIKDKQDFQQFLLSLFDKEILSKADEVEILEVFINLCFEYSLDAGWAPESILQSLHLQVSDQTRAEEKFQIWERKANDIFSGSGELAIPLDDEGSAILRSIILVLLNPELDNLVAIKESFGDKIGNKVFSTAKKLVLLRSGYSLLNHDERLKLGKSRTFVQDLNAALYNKELSSLQDYKLKVEELFVRTPYVIEEPRIGENTEKEATFSLAKVSFVRELEERLDDNKVYAIDCLVPNAGFKAKLIEKSNGEICFWLIDRRGDERSSKYKGKIGLDLLQVQSVLPSEFRFEVDIEGVYLRLPEWVDSENDLLQVLKLACQELAFVKPFNIRKSTLFK